MQSDTYWGYTDPVLLTLRGDERRQYFRLKLWERDSGQCQICGKSVALAAMQMDHIQPQHEGGPDHWDNLRATHFRCNRWRPTTDAAAKGLVTAQAILTAYPGMTRIALYRLVNAGRIPFYELERRPWDTRRRFLFSLDEVRAAVDAMKRSAP